MKRSLLLLLLSAYIFFSCSKEKEQETVGKMVSIRGAITNPTSEKISVSYTSSGLDRENITLAETTLDSTNSFVLNFELTKPVQAWFTNEKLFTKVYLVPGDELSVTADAAEFKETVAWEGIGAERQNYLAKKKLLSEKLMAKFEGGIPELYSLSLDSFEIATTSISKAKDSLYASFFDILEVSEEFAVYEKASLLGDWLNGKMNYPSFHEYYAGKNEFEVPDSYYAFIDSVALDEKYLVSDTYQRYLESLLEKEYSAYTKENPKDSSVNEFAGYCLKMFEIASSMKVSVPIKDFLTANMVYTYISNLGADSIADSLITSYKTVNTTTEHLASIEKLYKKWSMLTEGNPAPSFTYTSFDSTEVSLSDFVGKVVYIDIWATWCKPCLAEIPFSKKLHQEFSDREDLVFLYVSLDDDVEAWKKMLAENDEFRTMGVHLISDNGWETKITEDYAISGIPSYILIGKDGNIFDATVAPPSYAEEVKEAIETLLTEGMVSKL